MLFDTDRHHAGETLTLIAMTPTVLFWDYRIYELKIYKMGPRINPDFSDPLSFL